MDGSGRIREAYRSLRERVVSGVQRLGRQPKAVSNRANRGELGEYLLIAPLNPDTVTAGFSCGDEDLDSFLDDDAANYHQQYLASVYIATYADECVGYVALLTDSIKLKSGERRKHRLGRSLPVVPALKIGRLAVSSSFSDEYRGLGTALVRHAADVAYVAQEAVGCRFLTVDSYARSADFYKKLGFLENKEYRERLAPLTVSMRFDLRRSDLPDWIL